MSSWALIGLVVMGYRPLYHAWQMEPDNGNDDDLFSQVSIPIAQPFQMSSGVCAMVSLIRKE